MQFYFKLFETLQMFCSWSESGRRRGHRYFLLALRLLDYMRFAMEATTEWKMGGGGGTHSSSTVLGLGISTPPPPPPQISKFCLGLGEATKVFYPQRPDCRSLIYSQYQLMFVLRPSTKIAQTALPNKMAPRTLDKNILKQHLLLKHWPKFGLNIFYSISIIQHTKGAQWLSGRVLDSRQKGLRFESHRRHCVVSLSKNINPTEEDPFLYI